MKKVTKPIAVLLAVVMIVGILPSISLSAKAEGSFMEITSGNYLSTVGSNVFNVFMYDNTYSGTFGDQHMSGIEMSLSGIRIVTNGDIHYLPTPEQWDATPAPSRGNRNFDKTTNTATVSMSFNGAKDGTLRYNIVASPTDTGVKLQVVLTGPMPASLLGKARFNLEFLPLAYRNKTYQADLNADGVYDDFGSFPLHPKDEMVETERPDIQNQAWYVTEWNEMRGDAQATPFATGYGFTFAPEDPDYSITITSALGEEGEKLELYDGRNRSQNGWYVLSTVINKGNQGDVVAEWDISPNVDTNWIREPNVGFSQVGYSPEQEKFAVVELDKFDETYSKEIKLLRVNADGSEDVVKTGTLGNPTAWLRYKDVRFDFTEVQDVGLYRIEYEGQKSEVFPIAKDVYDDIWQTALTGFLTVAMDHMEVREGYKIWHGAAHMDDASIGDRNASWFDGMSMQTMPQAIRNKGYKGEDHIPGLNKGGWYDAGDFDLQISRNVGVWGTLVTTAQGTNYLDNYDTLTVTWDDATGGSAEMHRPDGIPDIIQHCVHGAKQMLAEYECLGGTGGTMETRMLRQYTHLGDPSSDTDGFVYDPNLAEDEIVTRDDGVTYSGRADDRYFLTAGGGGSFSAGIGNHYINFAATAAMSVPYEPLQDYAKHLFEVALTQAGNASSNWNALVQFTLAAKAFEEAGVDYEGSDTYSYEYFKGLFDSQVGSHLSANNNMSIFACKDLLTEEQWAQVGQSVKSSADGQTESSEVYGLRPYQGASWGNSVGAYSGQTNNAIMYYNFPEEGAGFKQNILRAVNYVLGRHPITNASYISGVGTKSALHPYNSNRGDESFIPGSILPGHITFNDFGESLDDFSYLWFENESIINYQSSWLAVGLAASKMAQNEKGEEKVAESKDFESNFDAELVTKTTQSAWGGGSTDGYFSDKGFNVLMYSTTFDRTFGDQHCAGIELVQNGRRVATNGDIHLLPTPEQWDATPPPTRGTREFDTENKKVTVNMTLPKETVGEPDNPDNPPPQVDKSALIAAINEAEALNKELYTEDSWAAVESALTAAKAQNSSATATQQAVNDATKALNDAVAALVKIDVNAVDTGALEAAITAAEALNEDEYTEESWAALETALAAAKAAKEAAESQEAVDAAKDALNAAVAALEKKPVTPDVNTEELAAAITAAEALNKDEYTEESWAALETALAAAKAAKEAAESQEAVDAAKDALNAAVAALEKKPIATQPDLTALEEAITAAEALNKDEYTEESWAALETALAAAKAAKTAETQAEVDAAKDDLLAAIEALEKTETPPPPPPFQFDDVQNPEKYYYEPVYWAYNHEPQITKGTSDTLFSPDAPCTRGQVVTFLYRAAGEPEITGGNNPFTDVAEGKFYYKAVLWAVEKGITNGVTKTTFQPNTVCNRSQIVTFLWRFAGEKAPEKTDNPFTDVAEGKFYYNAVLWAVEAGVTKGVTETTFEPDTVCTRGQVVTFLFRATAE